jgi:hypothetical protein
VVRDVATAYLAVGAGWAVVSRLGLRPLGFEDPIVLLTAIHFHHAGFVLPVLAAALAEERGSRLADVVALVVVVAVPLVALGITATQLGAPLGFERVGSWLLTLAALGVALGHARLALDRQFVAPARVAWAVATLALALGMTLAALYAARSAVGPPALDLPAMRALHGTANALGFALPALLGWRAGAASRTDPPTES